MTSSRWGWAAAGLLVAGAAAVWASTRRVTISRHRIGRPDGERPLRLVQLSDLHLRSFDRLARRVADETLALAPDRVLLTGDAVEDLDGLDALDRLLARIATPGFAVIGNWEYGAGVHIDQLGELYARHGIRLLVNETVEMETRRGPIAVTGLDDAVEGDARPEGTWSGSVGGERRVAIAHEPTVRDRFDPADEATPLWMAAGHTHGGQVRLPGWVPVLPARSRGYVSGWFRDRRPWLYVSRGIGTSRLPVRLFAPPEIAVFDWWPA